MSTIKRASFEEIKRMAREGEVVRPLPTLGGEDLGPEFWADAMLMEPKAPRSVHLKVDPDVFDFFKSQGKGHLTRMQDVLKAYVRAHSR